MLQCVMILMLSWAGVDGTESYCVTRAEMARLASLSTPYGPRVAGDTLAYATDEDGPHGAAGELDLWQSDLCQVIPDVGCPRGVK